MRIVLGKTRRPSDEISQVIDAALEDEPVLRMLMQRARRGVGARAAPRGPRPRRSDGRGASEPPPYCSGVMTPPRLSIRWAGGDLVAVLEGYGVDIGGGIVELASARIELERAGRPAGLPQLDVDELPSSAGPAAASSAVIDVAAVGWAT